MKRKLDFDILESLRGFAAFYVCLAHCRGVLWIGGEHFIKIHPQSTWSIGDYALISANMLTRLATEFVIIFFVLSGFSIAHSLRNRQAPGQFYKRRFVRLYPPYVTAILWGTGVLALLLILFPQAFTSAFNSLTFDRLKVSAGLKIGEDGHKISDGLFNIRVFLKNIFYLPEMGGLLNPLWSLTHEVIFYLIAPFAFRNRKLYYGLSLFGFAAASFIYSRGLMPHNIPLDFCSFNLFFAAGVFLYNNYESFIVKLPILTRKSSLLICLGIYLLMIGLSLKNFTITNSLMAGCLSIILIIYLVTNNVRIKPLISLGRFSYTLYITHFPTIFIYLAIYYAITGSTSSFIYNNLVFIPAVLLCLITAYLLYILVERRTKLVLDKLRVRNERRAAAATLAMEQERTNA